MDDLAKAVHAMLDRMDDHDLLITIATKMDGVKTDVQELKNNTAGRIQSVETRQQTADEEIRRLATKVNIGVGICMSASVAISLILKFAFK